MAQPLRIAVIGNGAFSLVNFRGPLIREMRLRGAEVFALAPDYTAELRQQVGTLGATPIDISLDRMRVNPLRDLRDMMRLRRQLATIAPEICFSYFLKPVIFGTLAAWLARVPRRYSLVAGLGYLFTDSDERVSFRKRFLKAAVMLLCRFAFSRCDRVFFQNCEDLAHFVDAGAVAQEKTVQLAGTGVDLAHFSELPLPSGPVRFLFVGRVLREKGICELIEAARRVQRTHPECQFAIAGGVDINPGAIRAEGMVEMMAGTTCEWLGHVPDIRAELARCTVFVLPSYREGMPRSTQEALAVGRPVITTNAIGCRETVKEGENGWLVPVGDADALADAMLDCLQNRDRLPAMGHASRRRAETNYDVREINDTMLAAMGVVKTDVTFE